MERESCGERGIDVGRDRGREIGETREDGAGKMRGELKVREWERRSCVREGGREDERKGGGGNSVSILPSKQKFKAIINFRSTRTCTCRLLT